MATQIIPPGYSKVTFTFTLTGSTRFFQTSCEVSNLLLDGNPINLLAAVRNGFCTSGGPFLASNLLTGYTMTEAKILMNTLGGVLLSHVNSTPIIGSKTGSPPPINTSVIVRKIVAPAGKKYRGRMLVPPFHLVESLIDAAGNIDVTALAAYQALWNQAYTAITPSNPIVLLHSDPLLTPTPVSSLTVNPRIGTIGKRMRG